MIPRLFPNVTDADEDLKRLNDEAISQFNIEIAMLRRLSGHPNILHMFGTSCCEWFCVGRNCRFFMLSDLSLQR